MSSSSRLHRFYVHGMHNKYGPIELTHELWLHDDRLLHQWMRVLRYTTGQQVILFDGIKHERMYEINELSDQGAHLKLITDFERKVPQKRIYLAWSLLKKDKNDWVLQKATEVGAHAFIPIIADRSEKTGFNVERAEKIVIEAAEQCGRSDIPTVREPVHITKIFDEFNDNVPIYIAEMETESDIAAVVEEAVVCIGPEGGWSEQEKSLFMQKEVAHINLGLFTMRAETAAITAVQKLVQ